ncbi:MAG: ribonuclease H-like domain-containing protein, partial [Clostridia bacterium]|nr:ribonuclease H-like domain-containing protein [Clostridia bacterium]
DFTITTQEDTEFLDEVDIENVELKTSYKPVPRYKVEIVKEVVGKDINPNPEYISNIKKSKPVAIVAGYIKKIERREFIRKSGKYEGQPKALYSIQLQDEKGKMDCVYFSSKSNEKVMDSLEEFMYVLLQGEVKPNYMGKLSLNIKKIALATKVEKEVEIKPSKINYNADGSVVKIENLSSLKQDNMFSNENIYNDKIMGKTIVVFDLETTGLDFDNDQITEIGAVKIVDGKIKEKFSTFVKPTIHIPEQVTEITGITDDMVKDAPPVELVIRDFYNFTRGCVLSGHNILDFDIKFVKRDAKAIGLNFDNPTIDTLLEARRANLGISRFNLGTVVKTLGLTLEGAHRAWNDAYATAQVLLKLNEINRK